MYLMILIGALYKLHINKLFGYSRRHQLLARGGHYDNCLIDR